MKMKEHTKTLICLIAAALGIIMINAGIMNGEVKTVEQKSTNICLECIGIG